MIIGLTGRICAGKGTFLNYFREKGFGTYTISDAVKKEARKRGFEITRENLQNLGNLIRIEEGAGAWARRLFEIANEENYIIDGIRNPAEIEEIRKLKNSVVVAIDAPQEIRYQRFLERKRDIDIGKSREDFLKEDEREYDEGTALGFRVRDCMAMADFHLVNNLTLEEFYQKLEEVYREIMNGKFDK